MNYKKRRKRKEFFYAYDWHIFLGILALVIISSLFWDVPDAWWGIPFALFYFLHKQNLEESQFSMEMFKDFNERYDALNDILNDSEHPEFKKKLIDYFNLCAEEYMLYRDGYVPLAIWKSWRAGMLYYLHKEEIRLIYQLEFSSEVKESYYGFSIAELEKLD